jgi:hypothetical protein
MTKQEKQEEENTGQREKHSFGHHNHSYSKQEDFATLPTNQFQD